MDVFGTVVGAVDLIGKLIGYLQVVRGAREDRLKLLSEVSALGALLEVLRGRLGNPSANGNNDSISARLVKIGINRPLRMCLDALGPIVESLERVVPNVNIGISSPLAERMKDFRWPFRQEGIRATLGNIERLKTLVSLALHTSLMDFIEKAHDELAVVGTNVADIKSIVSSLEANQRAHMERIEGTLKDLGTAFQRSANGAMAIQGAIETIDRSRQDKERRDVLKWLSAPEFDQENTSTFGKRAAGTGEWFLRHPEFMAWRQGKYSVLWCPGNPGVGKSVMTSVVIHDLQEGMAKNEATVFVYFNHTINYTTQQLIKALLSQLVRRGVSNSSMKSFQKHMEYNRLTLEELWAILKAEVETYAQVFVVIDALDEAPGLTWIPLLRGLRTLRGIRILTTSRNLGNIATEFQGDHRLDVISDEGDLRKYVGGRISDSTGSFEHMLKRNPSLRSEIITGVVERADGMFLLAQLHMNALETESRVIDLRRALGKLPGDLNSAYDATMDRISSKDKTLALRIFSWVIHAVRPLEIDDLQYALAVGDGMTAIDVDFLHDEAHITSVCVGLVVVRREKFPILSGGRVCHYVGLVHYTTWDYLCDHVSTQLPHPTHLAITCLKYLAFDIFNRSLNRDSKRELMDTPLAEYAIYHWGMHARMHSNNPDVRRLAMELLRNNRRVSALGFLTRRGFSAIQLCAHFGLKDYLLYLLDDHGFDVNSMDSNGDTALTVAATRGHEETLRLLLTREGIDVNSKGWRGATPLIRAVMSRHRRIVELLLARGDVDVNQCDNDGKTPIAHAAIDGHNEIVGLLLTRGDVDIGLQDEDGFTPLTSAIRWGHDAIVQLLLASGNVNANRAGDGGVSADM